MGKLPIYFEIQNPEIKEINIKIYLMLELLFEIDGILLDYLDYPDYYNMEIRKNLINIQVNLNKLFFDIKDYLERKENEKH